MTKPEFQAFADELAANGKLFHFEDDPADIVDSKTGERLFTGEELVKVKATVDEAFKSNFDPMACCVAAFEKIQKKKTE